MTTPAMNPTNQTPNRAINRAISRRAAVGRMVLQTAGIAGASSIALARAPSAGAIRVERQSTGAEIWQVTTEEFSQSNIYCEVPYCSSDSRYFVYQRTNPKLKTNRTELMVVELGTWKQHRLDTTLGIGGSTITPDGTFYYLKQADGGANTPTEGSAVDLFRADLANGAIEKVYRFQEGVTIRSLGTVSSDHRYYAGGTMVEPGWTQFDVLLVDLETGKQTILDQDPFILNPHPQFDPKTGRQLMIQHNRGGRYTPDGKLERLVGPEGATLYVLSVPGGKRTTLQVGPPHTTACTGHEAWIGNTQEMLLSVSARGDYVQEKGNLLGVRPGQPARVVAKGFRFNHVGVSHCGRLFSADDWQRAYKVVIGSNQTGRTAVVCDSLTKPERGQNTHTHPYLTPDLQWVIFNSNRTGFPHIYAARVPEAMLDDVLRA